MRNQKQGQLELIKKKLSGKNRPQGAAGGGRAWVTGAFLLAAQVVWGASYYEDGQIGEGIWGREWGDQGVCSNSRQRQRAGVCVGQGRVRGSMWGT